MPNITLDDTTYPLRFGPFERENLGRFTDLPAMRERLRTGRTATLDGFTVLVWALRGGGYDGEIGPLLSASTPGGKEAVEKLALELLTEAE